MRRLNIELPDSDSYGSPISKMPDCPCCGEDELAMIAHDILCYACGFGINNFKGLPVSPNE